MSVPTSLGLQAEQLGVLAAVRCVVDRSRRCTVYLPVSVSGVEGSIVVGNSCPGLQIMREKGHGSKFHSAQPSCSIVTSAPTVRVTMVELLTPKSRLWESRLRRTTTEQGQEVACHRSR